VYKNNFLPLYPPSAHLFLIQHDRYTSTPLFNVWLLDHCNVFEKLT